MIALLDVNVLIALLDTRHNFHGPAWQWFDENRSGGWATCPVTENGFVRIVSNPRYGNSGATPAIAIDLLGQLTAAPDHIFWMDEISLIGSKSITASNITSHKMVTDIYLLALAVHKGGQLATFDRRLATNAVAGGKQAALVIPA